MLRWLLASLVCFVAVEAQAVTVDSVWRETTFWGGLETPNMLDDTVTSSSIGSFYESFSDTLSSPGYGDAGIGVSQTSSIDLQYGTLSIEVVGDASNFATSLTGGAVADSFAQSELEIAFTATENVFLSVDVIVSSALGVFSDGPGAGVVETSHFGRILICVVGGGCLVDIVVDDVTDNGLAVSDGVLDSAWILPGQYVIELLAVSQSISRDVGSASGSVGFSGSITLTPAPEPSATAMLGAGAAMLVLLRRARRRRSRSCEAALIR